MMRNRSKWTISTSSELESIRVLIPFVISGKFEFSPEKSIDLENKREKITTQILNQ